MTLRGSKVLVVDDEPLVRMFAVEALAEAGYVVLEAGTGDEALRIISTGTPLAAVVTDLEMPGTVDGLELARTMEARWPTIPVVVVSGRRLPRVEELPLKASFLAKPYSPALLISTIAAL
jgi:two-component system, response regulator PdtaR